MVLAGRNRPANALLAVANDHVSDAPNQLHPSRDGTGVVIVGLVLEKTLSHSWPPCFVLAVHSAQARGAYFI